MRSGAMNSSGDANVAVLERIVELLEASVRLQMGPVLEREVSDQKMRQLYDATGIMTATDLAKRFHVSATTVCAAWKRWEEAGLLVKHGKSFRKVI
jgi:hypothetical protein